MMLCDSVAYHISEDGAVTRAKQDARLPFVMVTVFEPEMAVVVREAGLALSGLRDVFAAGVPKGARNSFVPFRLRGRFSAVHVVSGFPRPGEEAAAAAWRTIKDVKGTVFGFAGPSWAKGYSVTGPQCCFLSEEDGQGGRKGGFVVGFEAEGEVRVEWALCGRFHLGLPQGEEWETLELSG
ncbi:hypothetical protein LTR28_001986 [Elasticomyces elasticus]|nr:hypothetical protein LTR28_001986 [Elasticomyces elasticus]